MGPISEDNQTKRREQLFNKLGITEKSIKTDVEMLRDWLEKQPHMPNLNHINLDEWLENQLIMAKNSLEKAKNNISKYLCVRVMCPELFVQRDVLDKNIAQSFETLTASYPAGLTDRLHKVCIVRVEDCPVEEFFFEPHLRRMLMALEYYLKEGIEFTGFHIVFDLQHFKLNHLTRFNLSVLRTMSTAMKAFPMSFAVINIINSPVFIEKALALFKPFISSKLYARIIPLKDIESLKEVIGRVSLPSDYGGDGLNQKELSDVMKNNCFKIRDYIKKCDELKCGDYKDYLKMHSNGNNMIGSFRMLTID